MCDEDRPDIAYISGPMSGYEDFNYPAFHRAAHKLGLAGYAVLSPADNFGGTTSHPRALYMAQDIRNVLASDAVFVLPGWTDSPGARLEVHIAQECDLPIYELDTGRPITMKIATSISRAVA